MLYRSQNIVSHLESYKTACMPKIVQITKEYERYPSAIFRTLYVVRGIAYFALVLGTAATGIAFLYTNAIIQILKVALMRVSTNFKFDEVCGREITKEFEAACDSKKNKLISILKVDESALWTFTQHADDAKNHAHIKNMHMNNLLQVMEALQSRPTLPRNAAEIKQLIIATLETKTPLIDVDSEVFLRKKRAEIGRELTFSFKLNIQWSIQAFREKLFPQKPTCPVTQIVQRLTQSSLLERLIQSILMIPVMLMMFSLQSIISLNILVCATTGVMLLGAYLSLILVCNTPLYFYDGLYPKIENQARLPESEPQHSNRSIELNMLLKGYFEAYEQARPKVGHVVATNVPQASISISEQIIHADKVQVLPYEGEVATNIELPLATEVTTISGFLFGRMNY